MRLRSRNLFETIRTEGGLLPSDLLQRVADGDPSLPGLDPASYHLAKGERLNEMATRSWTRLQGAWRNFSEAREALAEGESGASLTRERWLHVLFDELGYGRLTSQPAIEIDGKRYPVFTQWQNSPIHLVGSNVPIDRRSKGVAGAAAQSPHSLLQELLNRSPARLWGFASNGLVLRILRDNVALTRQAFVEFDLEAMMEAEAYADFVVLWLTCHESRVEGEDPHQCWLERWSQESAEQGTRALDALRDGVEQAIRVLGGGFLAHPDNTQLQEALRDGALTKDDYYRQVLRIVYRLLFLFVAEDRGALLVGDDRKAQARYSDHYSTARLRRLAARRRGGAHDDVYRSLRLVMDALNETGCEALALPALGSALWDPESIGLLADSQLANEDLLEAVRELGFVEERAVLRPVDFKNLGAEELGSIYESLLELHPDLDRQTAIFELSHAAGSERKTTGSYYTPTSLISALLDSALEPVIEEATSGKAREEAEEALLQLTVCDPACGSGHFLIAAANRIAKRLAAIRTDEAEPAPEAIRHALRDVVSNCLYGVDVNPMAIELCKVSLWMEALEPGRPLSFLDSHLLAGNSLLGTTPELIRGTIPDEAYKPIAGDDKRVASDWRKRNKQEHEGSQTLFKSSGEDRDPLALLARRARELNTTSDTSVEDIRRKQSRYADLLDSDERARAKLAADAWCSAFVAEKLPNRTPITTAVVQRAQNGSAEQGEELRTTVSECAKEYGFMHWHVAFPDLFSTNGPRGFDVVLGNPPWERLKLQEKEFFASRAPEIANAPNKAARQRLIDQLPEEDSALFDSFERAKRQAEGSSHLVRDSGRFPLCGRGDVNTYALFAELNRELTSPAGRVGCIVPSGIATDDTTKFFFQDLIERRFLSSLYDFENREGVFPGVHRSYKFCLLTLAGGDRPIEGGAEFVFFATRVEHLSDPVRRFSLTAEDIELLNPNTKTCPVFRTARDAEITKGIYRRVPVLIRDDDPDGNPWAISLSTMFHMSNDSHLFRNREQLEEDGWTLVGNVFKRNEREMLPLYEGKFGWIYNHRFASHDGSEARRLTPDELDDPRCLVLPQYWVPESSFAAARARRRSACSTAYLGTRRVTSVTNERSCVATVFPSQPSSYGWILWDGPAAPALLRLLAVTGSMAFDYVLRGKLSQASVPQGVLKQCPVPEFPMSQTDRVFELVYTSCDLRFFAKELGCEHGPFAWNAERRRLLTAENDALMLHLYGISADEAAHILDSFPIVRRQEQEFYGEYLTKRLVLDIYADMADAASRGEKYATRLDPAPADPSVARTS